MSDTPSFQYDRHPVMFRNRPATFTVLFVLVLAPLTVLLMYRDGIMGHEYGAPAAVALIATAVTAFLMLMIWFLQTRGKRLRIGGDEIHLELGLLSKRHIDLHVSQVRTVRVTQGFLERILSVGQIEVYTTGDLPEFTVKGMPNPHRVRDYIRNRRAAAE